jgi:hypothetical protein
MKSFLKTNIVLVVGVALPLLLMAFFYLAQRASVAGIDPPGYDAVIAVDYHDRWTDYPYRIGVDEGKLVVRYRPGAGGKSEDRRAPRLYVVDHATHDARALDIDFGSVEDGAVTDPDIDALNRNRLIPDPTSPDGYRFERLSRSSGGGLVGGLFGFGRHRSGYALKKGARVVPINGSSDWGQAQFIAWIGK